VAFTQSISIGTPAEISIEAPIIKEFEKDKKRRGYS
jgi:hypothetical protein